MMLNLDRREALLLTSGGLAMTLALGGCDWLFDKIKNRPVRKDIKGLASNDPVLEAYRDGIARMRALKPGDRRYWHNVAKVHYDHCPHGNWFFLPWHRAYLMMIENIIRTLTGAKEFAMPYWDWRCARQVPPAFWEQGSVLNPATPVAHPIDQFSRAIGPSDSADPTFTGQAVLDSILNETEFELFASSAPADGTLGGEGVSGRLEATPHNYIHGTFILGTMGDYYSPLDPIFWLHHCALDYFWFAWNARGNSNMSDPAWTDMNFDMFTDGNGQAIDQKAGLMPLAPLLSYRYQDPTGCIRPFSEVDEKVLKGFLERATQVPVKPTRRFPAPPRPLALDPQRSPTATIAVPPDALRAAAEGSGERLLLTISKVTPPAGDGTFVRVFLDLPAGSAPSPESPHFAGAFAFFSDPHHPHAFNTRVDLTDVVRKLGATARGEVTLVATPGLAKAAAPSPVRIGQLGFEAIAARQPPPLLRAG